MGRAVTSYEVISLKTGVALEVAISCPVPRGKATRVAFCLHPWSWLGGSMYDATIQGVVKLLQDNEFHVVYYNSRGVGKSTGWPSLTGQSEGRDLEALVQHFLEENPRVNSVTFVGYSHGSLIATLHPVLPVHIKTSYVLLSYPLSPRGLLTLFHTNTYSSALVTLLRDPHARLLVVYGDQDDFTSHSKYEAWAESLGRMDGARAQLKIVSVAGANHFWQGKSSRAALRETLVRWVLDHDGAGE